MYDCVAVCDESSEMALNIVDVMKHGLQIRLKRCGPVYGFAAYRSLHHHHCKLQRLTPDVGLISTSEVRFKPWPVISQRHNCRLLNSTVGVLRHRSPLPIRLTKHGTHFLFYVNWNRALRAFYVP